MSTASDQVPREGLYRVFADEIAGLHQHAKALTTGPTLDTRALTALVAEMSGWLCDCAVRLDAAHSGDPAALEAAASLIPDVALANKFLAEAVVDLLRVGGPGVISNGWATRGARSDLSRMVSRLGNNSESGRAYYEAMADHPIGRATAEDYHRLSAAATARTTTPAAHAAPATSTEFPQVSVNNTSRKRR